MTSYPSISWPEGKSFAFTVFDDPDSQTLRAGKEVYSLLTDLGFRTTKGVWPIRGKGKPSDHGATCADPSYLEWVQSLQEGGFEIGIHNATSHTSDRAETLRGLEAFARFFGDDPHTMAQHYYCSENLYWGDERVSGVNRLLYNLLTLGRNRKRFHGHRPGHALFWGDVCRARIQYVRNFVFRDINTLEACPFMPYHDPDRPSVNYWFASSEGSNVDRFVERIAEPGQERLEEEGGACIMYTHFGHGYLQGGKLDARFRSLMEKMSRRNGWFVPVGTLLDFLLSRREGEVLSASQRRRLEWRWIRNKLSYGTA